MVSDIYVCVFLFSGFSDAFISVLLLICVETAVSHPIAFCDIMSGIVLI